MEKLNKTDGATTYPADEGSPGLNPGLGRRKWRRQDGRWIIQSYLTNLPWQITWSNLKLSIDFFKYPHLALIPTSVAGLIFYKLYIRPRPSNYRCHLMLDKRERTFWCLGNRTRACNEQAPQADALAIHGNIATRLVLWPKVASCIWIFEWGTHSTEVALALLTQRPHSTRTHFSSTRGISRVQLAAKACNQYS